MAVEITHIRMSNGGTTHQHITHYRWKNLSTGAVDSSDKPSMVDWIDNKQGTAYVRSGSNRVGVGTVRPDNGQPYLRTYADGKWSNNLLSLPRF